MISQKLQDAINAQIVPKCGRPIFIFPCLISSLRKAMKVLLHG